MRRIEVDDSFYAKLNMLDQLGCMEDEALPQVSGSTQAEHALERMLARPYVFLEMGFLTEWSYEEPADGHGPVFNDFMTDTLSRLCDLLGRKAIGVKSARVFASCLFFYLDSYVFAKDRDVLEGGLRVLMEHVESLYPRVPVSAGFSRLYTYVVQGTLDGVSVGELSTLLKDCVSDLFRDDDVCGDIYFWSIVNRAIQLCGNTPEEKNDSLRDTCFKYVAKDAVNVFQYDPFQYVDTTNKTR